MQPARYRIASITESPFLICATAEAVAGGRAMSDAAVLKIEMMIAVTGSRHEPRVPSGLRDFWLVFSSGVCRDRRIAAGASRMVRRERLRRGGSESHADANLVSWPER